MYWSAELGEMEAGCNSFAATERRVTSHGRRNISLYCGADYLPVACRKDAGKDARLVSYAEAIFGKAIIKFPESQTLLVAFADFLLVDKCYELEKERERGGRGGGRLCKYKDVWKDAWACGSAGGGVLARFPWPVYSHKSVT